MGDVTSMKIAARFARAMRQVVAALRNTAIGILRRAGHTNIAAALRTYAARPLDVLALTGLT